jgi:hypothetical protein
MPKNPTMSLLIDDFDMISRDRILELTNQNVDIHEAFRFAINGPIGFNTVFISSNEKPHDPAILENITRLIHCINPPDCIDVNTAYQPKFIDIF